MPDLPCGTAAEIDAIAFIRENLPLAPVPGLPELSLHLACPSSGLHRLLGEDAASPYWAYLWSGGLALARFVLDRPETVAGRAVLDLGCGSGIVGIAAARAGAGSVLAADVDRHAAAATRLNAEANGATIEVMLADLTDGPPPPVEIVLVGDLFYAAALADRVARFLDRCIAGGMTVLVGDPGRAHLPEQRLHRLAAYTVAETRSRPDTPAAVFRFDSPSPEPERGWAAQPSLARTMSAPTARSFSSSRS